MGGKALQLINLNTERKTTSEFFKIYSDVVKPFHNLGFETHLVKFYREKQTHGDIDILIKNKSNLNIYNLIKENISTKGILKNGNVISFEYNNFQVDFICVNPKDWNTSIDFFDWDPTGNLCGKIAYRFGCIYGFKGLVYKFRSITSNFHEDIVLSTDSKKIFNFLGYSYEQYSEGFDTLKDIFDFIIFGKYFNKTIFQMEELTSIDRKRNKKRETYKKFIEYINSINYTRNYIFKENKLDYLEYINSYFPEANLIEKIKELKEKEKIANEIKLKFNGHILMELYPELTGKELGCIINGFKNSYYNFDKFILENTQEEILKQFQIFYKKQNNDKETI